MKLVHALIAKSIADTILMGVLAVGFYLTAFPPYFHGWGEATPHEIAGWVVNNAQPWDRVEVQLFIDGRFVATGSANLFRSDVKAAGWSKDEWHGYAFAIPMFAPGEHEARVYAMHSSAGRARRTLQLVGDPIRFEVDAHGTLHDLSKKVK